MLTCIVFGILITTFTAKSGLKSMAFERYLCPNFTHNQRISITLPGELKKGHFNNSSEKKL